jgi:hypothetical protein
MVCTVETVSVKGRRAAAGISGEDWPGQHCNLLSLKSAYRRKRKEINLNLGSIFILSAAL